MEIFDMKALGAHKARARSIFSQHSFLYTEIAERLFERLSLIKRCFTKGLFYGYHSDVLESIFNESDKIKERISATVNLSSPQAIVPFRDLHFDVVISLLHLHWMNDLPGMLWQSREILKPDGLFMAALWGGDTLTELRTCLTQAELELRGGVSPRISPMVGDKDAGGLMQRAQFALPVVDSDRLTVAYPDLRSLLLDIRGVGETNALCERSKVFAPRALFTRTEELYREHFSDSEGNLLATAEVIYLSGWSPHFSQQIPLAPGSAQIPLASALYVHKHSKD